MQQEETLRLLQAHWDEFARFGVKSLALFGSVARGEARAESDVDLLVEFNRPVGLFEFVALRDYLERILGRPVDLGTPDSLKPRLRDRVLREAVRVA
ncbi:MAG: nucleotidyltransferase family protein [Chloroflexi bacterium]|nr:nucleotidyltransferase family protein [Chloroflexota bacterium]